MSNSHIADVDIDLYGRAFDGIFGKGAERQSRRQALVQFKSKSDRRSSVRNGQFIDRDLYGRGDPRVFGPTARASTTAEPKNRKKPPRLSKLSLRSIIIPSTFLTKAKIDDVQLSPVTPITHQIPSPLSKRRDSQIIDEAKPPKLEIDYESPNQMNGLPGEVTEHSPFVDNTPRRVRSTRPGDDPITPVKAGVVLRVVKSLQSLSRPSSSRNLEPTPNTISFGDLKKAIEKSEAESINATVLMPITRKHRAVLKHSSTSSPSSSSSASPVERLTLSSRSFGNASSLDNQIISVQEHTLSDERYASPSTSASQEDPSTNSTSTTSSESRSFTHSSSHSSAHSSSRSSSTSSKKLMPVALHNFSSSSQSTPGSSTPPPTSSSKPSFQSPSEEFDTDVVSSLKQVQSLSDSSTETRNDSSESTHPVTSSNSSPSSLARTGDSNEFQTNSTSQSDKPHKTASLSTSSSSEGPDSDEITSVGSLDRQSSGEQNQSRTASQVNAVDGVKMPEKGGRSIDSQEKASNSISSDSSDSSNLDSGDREILLNNTVSSHEGKAIIVAVLRGSGDRSSCSSSDKERETKYIASGSSHSQPGEKAALMGNNRPSQQTGEIIEDANHRSSSETFNSSLHKEKQASSSSSSSSSSHESHSHSDEHQPSNIDRQVGYVDDADTSGSSSPSDKSSSKKSSKLHHSGSLSASKEEEQSTTSSSTENERGCENIASKEVSDSMSTKSSLDNGNSSDEAIRNVDGNEFQGSESDERTERKQILVPNEEEQDTEIQEVVVEVDDVPAMEDETAPHPGPDKEHSESTQFSDVAVAMSHSSKKDIEANDSDAFVDSDNPETAPVSTERSERSTEADDTNDTMDSESPEAAPLSTGVGSLESSNEADDSDEIVNLVNSQGALLFTDMEPGGKFADVDDSKESVDSRNPEAAPLSTDVGSSERSVERDASDGITDSNHPEAAPLSTDVGSSERSTEAEDSDDIVDTDLLEAAPLSTDVGSFERSAEMDSSTESLNSHNSKAVPLSTGGGSSERSAEGDTSDDITDSDHAESAPLSTDIGYSERSADVDDSDEIADSDHTEVGPLSTDIGPTERSIDVGDSKENAADHPEVAVLSTDVGSLERCNEAGDPSESMDSDNSAEQSEATDVACSEKNDVVGDSDDIADSDNLTQVPQLSVLGSHDNSTQQSSEFVDSDNSPAAASSSDVMSDSSTEMLSAWSAELDSDDSDDSDDFKSILGDNDM